MEDHRNQLIVIIAGYEAEMEWFLATNPGLPSRFPIHLHFPDYDVTSLLQIVRKMARSRQYRLSPDAEMTFRRRALAKQHEMHGEPFSNARWVRNVLEEAIRQHALRLFDRTALTREDVITLSAQDFGKEGADL